MDVRDTVQGPSYWWSTSGRDLANMLHEANYPEEAQRSFLSFYQTVICPQLGRQPDANSTKSGVGRMEIPLNTASSSKAQPGARRCVLSSTLASSGQ